MNECKPLAVGSGNIGNAVAGMALQQLGVVFKVRRCRFTLSNPS